MRLHHGSTLLVGALLIFATPQILMAGHHEGGRDHRRALAPRGGEVVWIGGLRVEQPSWVMVFGIDREGRLEFQTHGRTGVFVSPDLPASTVCERVGWGQESPECAWQLVVISDVPFAAPRRCSILEGFSIDRRGRWSAENSRKLCRLLGIRPEAVRVSLGPMAARGTQAYVYADGVFSSQLQAGLSCGGQVYVDGRFIGRGAEVLVGVAAGRRRVTVVTEDGRKCSQWVSFPYSPCDPYRAAQVWVHP